MRLLFILAIFTLSGCADLGTSSSSKEQQDEQITTILQPNKALEDNVPKELQPNEKTKPTDKVENKVKLPSTPPNQPIEVKVDNTQATPQCVTCNYWWFTAIGAALTSSLIWGLVRLRKSQIDTHKQQPGSSDNGLAQEIEALTKLIATKTREAETLAAKLKDRRDIKILQRVGQFQHALDFNRAQVASGKMSTEAAYREVELELEAALAELGISIYEIPLGIHVRKLPAESYELINAATSPSMELAGTVNKVRQRALVYKDATGQIHFLIPAKIDAYKI